MLKVFILLYLSSFIVTSQECLAISLEGGGGRGAYEAGVIFGLVNAENSPNMKYNVVTGISIGAVNSGGMAQYPIGQEVSMSNYLIAFWKSITGDSSIFVEWKGGLIDGLLFQRGLYDNSPAVNLSRTWINTPVRNITVGSTNLDLGILQNFNESVGLAIRDAIIASGSLPGFFPPHDFEGYTWADGGCITNLYVFSAIERCLEVTDDQHNITVDLIYDDRYTPLPTETSFKTPKVLERVYSIHGHDNSIWYTYNAQAAYPYVNFRYIFNPSVPIEPLLNFSTASIEFDIQLGIKDAQAMLNSNKPGRTIITELYNESRDIIYP